MKNERGFVNSYKKGSTEQRKAPEVSKGRLRARHVCARPVGGGEIATRADVRAVISHVTQRMPQADQCNGNLHTVIPFTLSELQKNNQLFSSERSVKRTRLILMTKETVLTFRLFVCISRSIRHFFELMIKITIFISGRGWKHTLEGKVSRARNIQHLFKYLFEYRRLPNFKLSSSC